MPFLDLQSLSEPALATQAISLSRASLCEAEWT